MLVLLAAVLVFFAGVAWGSAGFGVPWFFVGVMALGVKWRFVPFLVLAFFLGVGRVLIYEAQVPDLPLESVEFEGQVVAEVDRRVDHQKVTVSSPWGWTLIKLTPYEEVAFGDLLRVRAVLEPPSEDIDGFNYAKYLARYRTWSVAKGHVEVLESRLSLRGVIYTFKTKVEQRLNSLFFEPEASFAAGLLLGSRKGMPEELSAAFQRTGLTHIVAISGYNISLVIALMFAMLGFIPLKWRVIFSSVAIVLFCVLVGMSAAVVRAGIMGVITLWGLFTGRRSQAMFGLLWSALLMVLVNPYTLLYDVGFQLSFASTLGLLVIGPMLEFIKWPKQPVIREALLLTLAAQVTTLPLILYHFGRLSLVAPLANVLVAPFLPFAMLFAALAVPFGLPMALLAWAFLAAVEWIALLLAKLPFADAAVSLNFSSFLIVIFWLSAWVLRFYKSILVRAFGLASAAERRRALTLETGKRETQ